MTLMSGLASVFLLSSKLSLNVVLLVMSLFTVLGCPYGFLRCS